MLMDEVTLNKMQPGQKEPNEKVGSFVSGFLLGWGGGSGKMVIKMNPLSCFSELLGRRAGDSRTLESFPDGKNSDATNIY